jgi:hypothetical protein
MRFLLPIFLVCSLHAQTITVNSYIFNPPSSLLDGLVSYWALEESSSTRYDSETNPLVMDLTDNNTVTSVAGKVGNAAFFDNANTEWLSHLDSVELSRGNFDFTIVAWSKIRAFVGNMVIASQWSLTPGNQRSWRLWYNSSVGRYEFEVSNNGTAVQALQDSVFGGTTTNTWHFHVCIHDTVNNLLSISTDNGTPNTLAYALGVFDSTAPFTIGARGTAGADSFDGTLDECGIWDRVLTPAEITYLYNSGNGRTFPFLP